MNYVNSRDFSLKTWKVNHLDIVCSGKVEKEYAQGETIIKEGTLIKDFTYLKSGLVKLFRSDPFR